MLSRTYFIHFCLLFMHFPILKINTTLYFIYHKFRQDHILFCYITAITILVILCLLYQVEEPILLSIVLVFVIVTARNLYGILGSLGEHCTNSLGILSGIYVRMESCGHLDLFQNHISRWNTQYRIHLIKSAIK